MEELQSSLGDAVQTSRVLKKCFARMMTCEKKVFVDQLNMLVKRVTEEGEQRATPDWLTPVCLHKALSNSWCTVPGPGFTIRSPPSSLFKQNIGETTGQRRQGALC